LPAGDDDAAALGCRCLAGVLHDLVACDLDPGGEQWGTVRRTQIEKHPRSGIPDDAVASHVHVQHRLAAVSRTEMEPGRRRVSRVGESVAFDAEPNRSECRDHVALSARQVRVGHGDARTHPT
jgi:hypothetical protein